jgi:hypothetical protein
MDLWLVEALGRLGAVDAGDGIRIAHALDGYWWDSTKRLPDPRLLMRRSMEIGYEVRPWLAGDAGSEAADVILEEVCTEGQSAVVFGNPEVLGAVELSSLIRIEIDVAPKLDAFPLPRPPSRTITNDDFPDIVESIREAAILEFGPGADVPRDDGGR